MKVAHVKVRVNTKEKKAAAEGEGAEEEGGRGEEGGGGRRKRRRLPRSRRLRAGPAAADAVQGQAALAQKDYNEMMKDKLAAASALNKLRKEEEAKAKPQAPPDEYQRPRCSTER